MGKIGTYNGLTLTMVMQALSDKTFSFGMSANIVGSKARLRKLIERGRIRAEKKSSAQNAKLYCNAWDVLKYTSRTGEFNDFDYNI
jgi:hypothetical protein